MFCRAHHQRIHEVLLGLDASFLRQHQCFFGGGTAIVLQHDEYRESVDMDFMVSDIANYRALRLALQSRDTLAQFFGLGRGPLIALPEVRADQYGIRTALPLKTHAIKFEIVFEARIAFDQPGIEDHIAGVSRLTQADLVASKLLANVDRWGDVAVMSRDIIDLAMLQVTPILWNDGLRKAEDAYGVAVLDALTKARKRLLEEPQHLARCMQILQISVPQALVHQRLASLPSD